MYVPDEVVRRLRGVPADQVSAEGLKLCSEIIAEVKEIPGVAGVHVMAVSWEDAVPEILARIKEPTLSNREFSIGRFGAVPDGRTDATQAIGRAIAA